MAGLGHTLDFSDLVDFGRRFPGLAIERLEDLQREAHRVFHRRLEELVAQLSPVGASTRAGHIHFRPGWRNVPPDPESAIASLRPTKVSQTAPHGGVIDRGRQMAAAHQRVGKSGKRHLVRARMVGSIQAPIGVRAPVLLQLEQEQEELLQLAAQRVMGGD